MFKKSLLITATMALLSASSAFAANTTTQWDPTLHQAQSCTEVETAVKDYLQSHRTSGQFGPINKGGVMLNDAPTKAAMDSAGGIGGGGGGSDFSSTNVQKDGVDEPEVIKTNGSYIYYIDQAQGILRVLDPQSKKEVTSITLPKDYRNAQLLINGNTLVLVGSKSIVYAQDSYNRTFVSRDQQVLIALYNIAQTTPKLIQAYTLDGYLQDSRVVDNNLVIVSSQSLSRGPVYKAVNDMVYQNTTQSLDVSKFSIKASDVLPKWSTLIPTVIKNRNGTTRAITRKSTTTIDCTQFLYKKPDPQKGAQYGGEGLTTIVRLPLNVVGAKPQMKTIVANSSQIHVSNKSLYVTSPTYMRQPFACPFNALCMPWRGEGQYTSVYGFDLEGLTYKYATVVNGNTWNQYSMDENAQGVFRIVTSNWVDGKNSSSVYLISSDGKVTGKLENIAPGENFYGVRFINDYLYLVTYKQIDPLFVIDTSNVKNPTIVGQLKMPGYSTYLHPYGAMQNGVQYLIGLGYNTKTLENGGELQGGIKLDLYKVDFNKKDSKGNVDVSQAWTKTLGDAGSQTDALSNPRMFVYNTNTKELILPIVLAETKKAQSCNVIYDASGTEIKKDCYPYDQAITTFAGVKAWTLGVDMPTETMSLDYKSMIQNPYPTNYATPMEGDINSGVSVMAPTSTFIDPRWFSSLQSRVGYIGSQYYFVGNQFTHFFTKQDQQGVYVKYAK